jgi:nitroreductase
MKHQGGNMSGIVFMKTRNLEAIVEYYIQKIGCSLWLKQEDCLILRHGNFLLGFCAREDVSKDGMLTFFYSTKTEVDCIYEKLRKAAVEPPKMNPRYHIYHFFASDPEGRELEFQYFDHHIDSYLTGDDLLMTRRSVRDFEDSVIPEDLLNRIIDMSRFAPTSRNSQSYYFKIIRDKNIIQRLSEMRMGSSAPIARAPLAVAICSDPAISQRHLQDACIGAYHFMLTAWFHGLGTVWIAAMDRDDAKDILGIPNDHYIATITPLGFPLEKWKAAPNRKPVDWYLR